MNVYLQEPVYALGESRFTVEESVAAERTTSGVDTLRGAGFRAHFTCRNGDAVDGLAARTVEQLGDRLDRVSALVYATCLPLNGNVGRYDDFESTGDVKYLMDFPASRVQAACGLGEAQVVGINQQACTSMLGSIRLARGLLSAEPDLGDLLCVTADRFPEGAVYEQAYNLISDGGAAVVVSRAEAGFRILACHQITNGALVQASDDEAVGTYFNYTHRLVQETLAKAGIAIGDVDWIVAQNMNVNAWQILARLLGFDPQRVYFESLPEVGHVISGDNIINLRRLDDSGAVDRGDKVLMIMAGYGMNWQSVLLEKV